MGVDTVKLSYDHTILDVPFMSGPYCCSRRGSCSPWQHFATGGWRKGAKRGSAGPVRYQEWIHDVEDVRVIVKGAGSDIRLLWEGSVPKLLGIDGAAEPDAVFLVDRFLRSLIPGLPMPDVRRCDVTADFLDPDGRLLSAAVDWNPHDRSRYTQSVHHDRSSDGATVWQHNKTRGVRVYDKFAESLLDYRKRGRRPCEALWAAGLTRVEYQVRGEWLGRYGLDRLYRDFGRNCENALRPVVTGLLARVK